MRENKRELNYFHLCCKGSDVMFGKEQNELFNFTYE